MAVSKSSLAQNRVYQCVSLLAHLRRKIMAAVRMFDAQAVFMAQQLENGACRLGDPVHAIGAEVGVPLRRHDENMPRRQSANQLVKVERNVDKPALVAGEL